MNYNDTVLGYDLAGLNMNELVELNMKHSKKDIPDVVLVRKYFPKMRKKNRDRYWKLKHIPMGEEEAPKEEVKEDEKARESKTSRKKKNRNEVQTRNKARDMEILMRDIEEDPEMAGKVNMFKDQIKMDQLEEKMQGLDLQKEYEEKQVIQVKGKKKMKAKRRTDRGKAHQEKVKHAKQLERGLFKAIVGEDSDVEDDFPIVQLSNLMDELELKEEIKVKDETSENKEE